jgi:hypothetical protein
MQSIPFVLHRMDSHWTHRRMAMGQRKKMESETNSGEEIVGNSCLLFLSLNLILLHTKISEYVKCFPKHQMMNDWTIINELKRKGRGNEGETKGKRRGNAPCQNQEDLVLSYLLSSSFPRCNRVHTESMYQ